MVERILLNLLLILTPVFGYQLVMFYGNYQRNSKTVQYLMGGLTGVSSVLCMMFPVVTGAHYMWDMRWTAFLLAIMYGGLRGGTICGVILLAYRATVGGWFAWLICVADAIFLYTIALKNRKHIQGQKPVKQVLLSMVPSVSSYIIVEITIYLYFAFKHQSSAFLHQGFLFFFAYGIVTVFAFTLSVVLLENILTQIDMRKNLQQSEKINLVGNLASSFAHEIRNPLTVAKGFVQFIGESLNVEEKYYTDLVVSELNRAENIITDYLNLAKPQLNHLQVIALEDVIENLVTFMSPFANTHNATITCDIESGLYVYVDVQRFMQVAMNIIKNSIEALPNRGQVHLVANKHGDKVLITIEDNGMGMTDDQLERLGKPFYSTKSKGTGLGLMVTLRLIEEMKGTVHFESTVGVGTKVSIQFPIEIGYTQSTTNLSEPSASAPI